jgi:transcription elongation factor Elf1
MLENKRYLGAGEYPAIITREQFNRARFVHDNKVAGTANTPSTDSKALWKRITCGKCGSRMIRVGRVPVHKGYVIIKCTNPDCGERYKLRTDSLFQYVLRLQNAALETIADEKDAVYNLSEETIKLNNQISREIEKPDNPSAIVTHILQGVTARYNGLHDPLRDLPLTIQYGMETHLPDIDWKLFPEVFSYISIGKDEIGAGLVNGKEISLNKEKGEVNHGTERSSGNPGQSHAGAAFRQLDVGKGPHGGIRACQHRRRGSDQQL